jgi:hypothetical protein
VLRVGTLRLNGKALTWDTRSSSKDQLRSFVSVVFAKLRTIPGAAGLEECELFSAVFLFLKGVSMNFGLFHTYEVLRREFGRDCMLVGDSLEYSLDTSQTPSGLRFRASVAWRQLGNVRGLPSFEDAEIVPSVRGSLHSLHAEFHLDATEPVSFVASIGSAPLGGLCSRIVAARRRQRPVSVKDEQLHSIS